MTHSTRKACLSIRQLLPVFIPPFLQLLRTFTQPSSTHVSLCQAVEKPNTSYTIWTFEALCYNNLSNESRVSQSRMFMPLEKMSIHHKTVAAVMDRGERWGQAGQYRADAPMDNRVESVDLSFGSFGQINWSSSDVVLLCSPHLLDVLTQHKRMNHLDAILCHHCALP